MTTQLKRETSCKWIDELDCDADNNGLDRAQCLFYKSDEYDCIKNSVDFFLDKQNRYGYCTSPGFDHQDYIDDHCLSYEYP